MVAQDTDSVDVRDEKQGAEQAPTLGELLREVGKPNSPTEPYGFTDVELPKPATLAEGFLYALARIEDAQQRARECLDALFGASSFDWCEDDLTVEFRLAREGLEGADEQLGEIRLAVLKLLRAVNRSPLVQVDQETWTAMRGMAPKPSTFPDEVIKAAVLRHARACGATTVTDQAGQPASGSEKSNAGRVTTRLVSVAIGEPERIDEDFDFVVPVDRYNGLKDELRGLVASYTAECAGRLLGMKIGPGLQTSSPTAKGTRKPGRRNSAKKNVHGGRSKRK